MRIAMGVEYDGAPYAGWQIQQEGISTVQGHVEAALSQVADHPVRVFCAGRTDTGVHATHQVIHFDSDAQRNERSWVFGANANLPHDIAVRWAKPVDNAFHARFSAQRRRYRYVIFCRSVRPTFMAHKVSWYFRPLDVERMRLAAKALVGEHDFSSYRALGCQAKSPVRTLYQLDINQQGEYIFLDLEANGFLHHMVRNIAGVLMAIGSGERETRWAQEVLDHRDRTLGGVTAPPFGLYFVGVTYPEKYELPSNSFTALPW